MPTKYLFVRILEACNADCFMCEFALSREPYRYTTGALHNLLPLAKQSGVTIMRFTGGEPLMHSEIAALIQKCSDAGMATSVITNGALLSRKAQELSDAGLSQVIVSLDSASSRAHNLFRNTPKLFESAMAGIARCRDKGIRIRINTVVGPHNFNETQHMQRIFSDTGMSSWELSALKLGRGIRYPDAQAVLDACEPVYLPDNVAMVVPLGKRFYGETHEEQERFFSGGAPPRASGPLCETTQDVMFFDPRKNKCYACSLLAYADGGAGINTISDGDVNMLETRDFTEHREKFRLIGAQTCLNCSATAAGYSDRRSASTYVPAWRY